MDSLSAFGDDRDHGAPDDIAPAAPLDDRRIQIRAYRRWASLLHGRACPSIHDMDPASLDSPHSVLLDLSGGNDNPLLTKLGRALRDECGEAEVQAVRDVPADSLLSRLTSHYPAVLATGEPIAFEGEELGPAGEHILYRAILLPLSDGSDRIDFIAGMLTWREFADSAETAAIAFEVGRSLGSVPRGAVQPAWSAAAASFREVPHPELPLGA